LNEQIDTFAAIVRSDPKLANGFNMIGHSQGGLITRAYVERYNNPPVYNLISWAGKKERKKEEPRERKKKKERRKREERERKEKERRERKTSRIQRVVIIQPSSSSSPLFFHHIFVGPHGGQYGVPEVNYLCPDDDCPWLAELFDAFNNGRWTEDSVQKLFTFATYWRDPFNLAAYLKYSQFLADINNERPQRNATYRQRLLSLNHYLLVASPTMDEIVVPHTAPWFESFAPNQETVVTAWNETDGYKGDWLGLRTLDQSGRLSIVGIQCHHQDYPRETCKQFYDQYTKPLLNNTM
jgi:pimeloyl-ACP methyl ester carboxylesterase